MNTNTINKSHPRSLSCFYTVTVTSCGEQQISLWYSRRNPFHHLLENLVHVCAQFRRDLQKTITSQNKNINGIKRHKTQNMTTYFKWCLARAHPNTLFLWNIKDFLNLFFHSLWISIFQINLRTTTTNIKMANVKFGCLRWETPKKVNVKI